LGRLLEHDAVAGVRVVAGDAINQLAADDAADALAVGGILWASDVVINAGELIAASCKAVRV
jgi:hypothetical protein